MDGAVFAGDLVVNSKGWAVADDDVSVVRDFFVDFCKSAVGEIKCAPKW